MQFLLWQVVQSEWISRKAGSTHTLFSGRQTLIAWPCGALGPWLVDQLLHVVPTPFLIRMQMRDLQVDDG